MITSTGVEGIAKYQTVDVSRPLISVSEICDAGGEWGQQVIFGRSGGMILNLETGRRTYFSREDDIYVLEMWAKPGDKSDFMGQGQER